MFGINNSTGVSKHSEIFFKYFNSPAEIKSSSMEKYCRHCWRSSRQSSKFYFI